jgi:hypothetical protein
MVFQLYPQSEELSLGVKPELTFGYKLFENLEFKGKIESKHSTYFQSSEKSGTWSHRYNSTDFQLFAAVPLHPLWKFAAGYQYQNDGDRENNNRTIQQISFVQPSVGYRLGYRLRTDQTFYKDQKTQFRVRYRLSVELPLHGLTVDPGEYYLVFSDELLYEIQESDSDLENRFALSVGHYFQSKNSLELGVDYRTDRYLIEGFRQRLWLTIDWYFRL